MRTLTFVGIEEGQKMFANIYSLFSVGERFLTGIKGIRSACRIYDGFDAISESVRGEQGEIGRKLRDVGGTVFLDEEEYKVLNDSVTMVLEMGANGQPSHQHFRLLDAREAIRVLDFLKGATSIQASTVEDN